MNLDLSEEQIAEINQIKTDSGSGQKLMNSTPLPRRARGRMRASEYLIFDSSVPGRCSRQNRFQL